MASLVFNVTDGNLSRVAPSDDGKIGFFALMTDTEAASDAMATNVVEFFSLKEAKAWLSSFSNIDTYNEIINVFEQIYGENQTAHVYFRFYLLDDEQTDFSGAMNNRIEDIINYSNNTVRLLLVHTNKFLVASMVTDINTRLSNRLASTQCGISAILSAKANTPIADPITLNAPFVSVVNANNSDGYGIGGTLAGVLSKAAVHENCGWVQEFRLNYDNDNTFYYGYDDTDIALMTQTQINAIGAKGYIIPVRLPDYSGWYFNDSFTATSAESDFFSIENNRVMHKAIRRVRTGLLPFLNSPVYVDATGKMRRDVVANLESAAGKGLAQMLNDGEISGYDVLINPAQNIISTGAIDVVISIRPVGVARNITVTIGFTV